MKDETKRTNFYLDKDIMIGVGVLDWNKNERISSRYGSFYLFNDVILRVPKALFHIKGYGKLIGRIRENRLSNHIGDIFHGFFPEKPDVGDVIELGEGILFYDEDIHGEMVGLKPLDNREVFWLNPKSLYRCHSQTVEVYFREVL